MTSKKNKYPAIPLITCNPYFNVWSMAAKLNEDFPRHWTGRVYYMTGIISIDKTPKTFMGRFKHNPHTTYDSFENIEQTEVTVTPLKSIYTFRDEKVELKVTFMTPCIPNELELLSRPVSYITYEILSVDGKEHDCRIYIDVSSVFAVDTEFDSVTFDRDDNSVFCGKGECDEMLAKSGDDLRIDWGYLHLAGNGGRTGVINNAKKYEILHSRQNVDCEELIGKTVFVNDEFPAIYFSKDYKVKDRTTDFVCIGYDDIYSIEYFGKKIKGYYTKDGATFNEVFKKAFDEYESVVKKVDNFDRKLLEEAKRIGDGYADMVSIAYRQVMGAHILAWDGEKAVYISKECFSNGCAATVDITYPSMPVYLITNPDLVEYMLNPIFEYAYSDEWKYEFAPHDAGCYPLVNGQAYGLEYETQMPIEECGNMLLCVAAICKKRKNTDLVLKHFELLNSWTHYLLKFGYDPENQLCTDDFAGHLAHNCNLSIKAILGIAAWGMILNMLGNENNLIETAKEYAEKWKKEAFEKDHYKLAFDMKDSWSIKYNLVWDKLLGLDIFDEDVFETEVEYYKKKVNKYGLPLDSRAVYTKTDWQMWSTVLVNDEAYRNIIIESILGMLSDTRNKVPFTDKYFTDDASQSGGFQNRSVQGGLFINLLNFD